MSSPNISPRSASLDDRIQYYIMLVLKLSVLIAMVLALYYRSWGAFGYSVLTLILMFLPRWIKSRANLNLPIEFDMVLVVFMYTAVFLGKVGSAYERYWWWDTVLHTSAGFILAYVAFLLLYIKVQQKKIEASPKLIGLIIFSVALAFGAVWEIFEFGLDALFHGNLQRTGIKDTMGDLIVDAMGALVMARIGVQLIFYHGRGLMYRLTHNFIQANPDLRRRPHD